MSESLSSKNICILIAASLAIFMFCIEYTGIVIVLPSMTKALHLNATSMQWCMVGYLLSFAAFILLSGYLGDQYGHRLIMILGLILFAVASLFGSVSWLAWQIIIARILQGLGAALIWPNATAIAFNLAPEKQKAIVISIVTSVVGFGMAAGPLLAGLLTHLWSWRMFFLVNVPLSFLAISLIFFSPQQSIYQTNSFNIFNLFLLILSVVFILLGLSLSNDTSADKFLNGLFILFGIGLFVYYIIIEKRSSHALFDASLQHNRLFISGCIIRAATNAAFYVFMFYVSLYLHVALHFSPLRTGVAFLPMTLMIGFFSPVGGKISDKFGCHIAVFLGLFLFIISYLSFIFLLQFTLNSYLAISLLFLLPGIAYGLSSPGLLTLTMKNLGKNKTGFASGFFYMASVLGSSLGIAAATIIYKTYQLNIFIAFDPILIFCIAATSIGVCLLLGYINKSLTIL